LARQLSITTLLDREATLKSIRAAIARLAKEGQPDDILLFYFSGHGFWTEPEKGSQPAMMIGCHDASANGDRGMVSVDELLAPFRDARAGQVVAVFDS